jgi:hypothetical protein
MTQTVQHYRAYFAAFVNLITSQEMERGGRKGKVIAFPQTGRKYDKVIIETTTTSGVEQEVKYFVEKKTGIIYGKKTDVAPNLRWYFGTIYTASKWNWGGSHPEPVDDDSVEQVGEYGDDIKHYRPKLKIPKNIPYPEHV